MLQIAGENMAGHGRRNLTVVLQLEADRGNGTALSIVDLMHFFEEESAIAKWDIR